MPPITAVRARAAQAIVERAVRREVDETRRVA